MKKTISALAAATMALTSIVSVPAFAADPAGDVRTYNTYPSLVAGMVAPNAVVEDGYFTSTDGKGTQIYWKKNVVPNSRGTVALIHGLAENQERYDYITYRLNLEGYSVYRLDHRGHGRSAEPYNNVRKNLIDNFDNVEKDMKQLMQKIRAEQTGKVFLMGHSMGAMAAQYYAVKNPNDFDALITNGGGVPVNVYGANNLQPEYIRADGTPSIKFLAPYLNQDGSRPLEPYDALLGVNVAGALGAVGVDINTVGSLPPHDSAWVLQNNDIPNSFKLGVVDDPQVLDQLSNDPLNSKRINLSTMYQIVYALSYAAQHAANYTGPTLIMHGDTDGLVPYPMDINWYNSVGSTDKHMILWEDMMHETMNSTARDKVIDRAIEFINAHN